MDSTINILRRIIFLLFCFASIVFTVDANEVAQLKINSTVIGSFKSSERHLYQISAGQNEIIEIVYEKKGVDLNLKIYSPRGEKILVANAEDGFSGHETLLFSAEKTGEYQLEITSRRPGNTSGNYTLSLTDERAPAENDLKRVAAMKLAGEAREMMQGAENRVEKATSAIVKMRQAIALFEQAKDLQGQANALFFIGLLTANEFGDSQKAVGIYDQAIEIWTKLGDEAGKAICLTQAANELRDGGINKKKLAFTYFNAALELDKKIGSLPDEAVTQSFYCRLYNNTGNFQKGFESCRRALKLTQNNDPLTDYFTYANLGSLYENTGGDDDSLKNYQLSLDRTLLIKDFLNPIRAASAKGNMAIILQRQKRYAEAEAFYQETIAVSEAVKRPHYLAYFMAQLSSLYYETNEFGKGLEYAEKSLALFRQIEPLKREVSLNAVGKNAAALGQTQKAREMFTESLAITRENKDRYAEAATLYNLAKLEKDTGNLETAQSLIEQAINISEIIRSELLGKNLRSSYLSILKRYYELKIEVLLRLDEKNHNANFSEQAWQTHEKNRARSLLENFLESGVNFNDALPKDFFVREKALLEQIADAETKCADAAKFNKTAARLAAENNLQKSLDDYHILQEEMRAVNPQFSTVSAPKTVSFADAQKLLDDDTAVLEYSLGEKQSYVWLIAKNSVKFIKLPPRREINEKSLNFYLALTDRTAKNENSIFENSKQLSSLILQPLAKEIANFRRLVVIADGVLQLVPFSALSLSSGADYQPLMTTTEIVTAPSLSTLVYLHENKINRQNAPDKLLAILADPIFQSDDERFGGSSKNKTKNQTNLPAQSAELTQTLRDFGIERLARLPFTGYEAREIAEFAPQKTVMATGANASRQRFLRGDFNSYQILHFATHGFLSQQNPDLSGLVLSLYDEKHKSQNGFLRVIDLYSVKLNADLVVLSACQTGLGKDVDGEGIVGLTRGFMYAGASRVVSSLWKVDDAATAELMKRFYRAMLTENQKPSAALRIAKNELRQIPRFKNPQYWAGFTLSGDWH